jgi:uncharacterized damage-inducible protein DinB
VTDPFVTASRELLAATFENILETLDGLSADQLNARLDLDGANSLAVIAMHATKSARSWAAVAMGAELPPRDRDAEFRTVVASPDDFLAEIRGVQEAALAYLDLTPSLPWEELRPTHVRADGSTSGVAGAWALLHAGEHAREHVAQMWLTRQALEDGRLTGDTRNERRS